MATDIRNKTPVTEAQKQEFIKSILPDEGNPDPTHKITLQFLLDSFSYSESDKQKYNNEYPIFFTKEELASLGFTIAETKIETTLGRIVFNYFSFFDPVLKRIFGYINKPFDKSTKGFIEDRIALAYVEDEIDNKIMHEFIDRWHWLGFGIASFMSLSLDIDTIRPLKEVEAAKKVAFKKHAEIISSNDVNAYIAVEKDLVNLAETTLTKMDTPGMAIYNSGASKGFGNNYKNTSMARGAIPRSNDFSQMNISTANLVDGVPKEDLWKYNDMLTTASFNRAVGTQIGGYIVKSLNASLGHVVLDERKSDCGTKRLYKVNLTKKDAMLYHLRFAKISNKLVLLKKDVLDSLVGQTIEIRSPLFCTSDKICNMCAGDAMYEFGSKLAGSLSTKIGSAVLNTSLKSFHDMSVKTSKIDILTSFKPIKLTIGKK
jgi:hypothetical protein